MPMVGFKRESSTRHMMQNGYRRFLIRNEKDLNAMVMHNDDYHGELAHSIGIKLRKQLIEKATSMGIKILNDKARMRLVEKE